MLHGGWLVRLGVILPLCVVGSVARGVHAVDPRASQEAALIRLMCPAIEKSEYEFYWVDPRERRDTVYHFKHHVEPPELIVVGRPKNVRYGEDGHRFGEIEVARVLFGAAKDKTLQATTSAKTDYHNQRFSSKPLQTFALTPDETKGASLYHIRYAFPLLSGHMIERTLLRLIGLQTTVNETAPRRTQRPHRC